MLTCIVFADTRYGLGADAEKNALERWERNKGDIRTPAHVFAFLQSPATSNTPALPQPKHLTPSLQR